MSPRRTEALHEVGYRQHLRTVIVIGFERGDLRGQGPLVMKSGGSADECGTDRFGTGHAGRFESPEGTDRFIIESN